VIEEVASRFLQFDLAFRIYTQVLGFLVT
jgi:hypothetical protein